MVGDLTGWDFFVVFYIVAFDEYIIKKLICKGNMKCGAIYMYAPLAGFTTVSSYDVDTQASGENTVKGSGATGKAIEEAVVVEKKEERLMDWG